MEINNTEKGFFMVSEELLNEPQTTEPQQADEYDAYGFYPDAAF